MPQQMRIDTEAFARRLREARMRAGLSQRALSAFLDRADCYIQQLESGRRMPSLRAIIDIAYALNVSPNQLLGDSLPEDVFGELPLFYGVCFRNGTIFRNSLTNWLNVDGPDESLIPPDPPVDLKKLPPLQFRKIGEKPPKLKFY